MVLGTLTSAVSPLSPCLFASVRSTVFVSDTAKDMAFMCDASSSIASSTLLVPDIISPENGLSLPFSSNPQELTTFARIVFILLISATSASWSIKNTPVPSSFVPIPISALKSSV